MLLEIPGATGTAGGAWPEGKAGGVPAGGQKHLPSADNTPGVRPAGAVGEGVPVVTLVFAAAG